MILSILDSEQLEVAASSAEEIAAKSYPWTARIVTDILVNVAIGGTATVNDFAVTPYESVLVSVPEGEVLSVFATSTANVQVSSVRVSA